MIINVRGTSGSGKTYTVRKFMDFYGPSTMINDNDGKPIAHVIFYNMMPVYFIGSYANVCGGCDNVPTQDMICSLVRHFSQFGHVIFEGLIMSHSYARYAALWKELTELCIPFIFAYMDTSLQDCLERVKQRRLDKGNTKEFNPQNTISAYDSIWGTMKKFQDAGVDTTIIKHKKDPIMQIINLLDKDKELRFDYSYREEKFR